ncbi:phosphate uptake regulator PhoU [Halovenus sp. WSH3]|uniref:Phosphate uptake regulator PhoU n=1 Tax=Halovenus carboxidivorans TaxID=2692199 RepID=A0A6B0TAP2_9EURY|nr:phosphate uptake regulator PhoU [Halovenus carboxidivorans]
MSLPKEWANEIDVGPGDTLRLYPHESQLVIEPSEVGDELKEASVEVEGYSDERIRRTILAFYTSGFSSITLAEPTGFDHSRRVVAETTRKLIGLEIIRSTETEITLKNLLNSTTVSVEQSTKQMQQVALSMHEDALGALLEQDADRAERVAERDDQVDRLYAMVLRQFQRALDNPVTTEELALERTALSDYQVTARQFERVGDHAVKIAELATQFEHPLPGDFADRIETAGRTARDIVDQAAATIIDNGETETAHTALDRRDELSADLKETERELHERDIEESHLIALTLDSLLRTAEYGGNIAETSLNTAARAEHL